MDRIAQIGTYVNVYGPFSTNLGFSIPSVTFCAFSTENVHTSIVTLYGGSINFLIAALYSPSESKPR